MIYCCQKCIEELRLRSVAAANLWINLCQLASEYHGIIHINESRIPEAIPVFRELESKGYIVTADGASSIKIRVEGFQHEDPDNDYFCINTFKHHQK